ncbi:MAG: F420-dependent methylenetetrahydromethanopterin dehydrogenase [Candidatus Heimdallarchaeota archaeon]|nr:F420-dependent methylenetetrahydromethanopterin dehydrogenase [Candidatus Heimdallarchaeota archaeon]
MSEKEEMRIKKVGILKLGNIASSVLLEMLLDERADRLDIDVQTISSGAKLEKKAIMRAFDLFSLTQYDLAIVATPNASLPAPQEVISKINQKNIPCIVLTDKLNKESKEKLIQEKIGFIIVESDAMIGARREFLDPIEMAIYNSDLIKVLAIGGVFSLIYQKVDELLIQLIEEKKFITPQITITPEKAAKYVQFSNPYAQAKARAALEIAEKVAKINSEGCFKIEERLDYIPQVTTGHEMMFAAAKLAEEAREIEKVQNKVRRQPHHYKGNVQEKFLLTEKPE